MVLVPEGSGRRPLNQEMVGAGEPCTSQGSWPEPFSSTTTSTSSSAPRMEGGAGGEVGMEVGEMLTTPQIQLPGWVRVQGD